MTDDILLVDDPRPFVRRLTLNRPEKRNALSNPLRQRLFDELERADLDDDVRITVIRGAGPSFSSGYDLGADNTKDRPYHSARGHEDWARHVITGWFRIWDLAKPVVAQVHGHCLAGGSELAAACDVVYAAEDAQIGYPPTRLMSPPDMQFHPWMMGMRRAMEMYLTGDSISGSQAAADGFATRAFPAERLEDETLAFAERAAKVPSDLQAFNKRAVHRAMEVMGIRDALRAGADIQSLAFRCPSSLDYVSRFRRDGTSVKALLEERDKPFATEG